jgi:hypothetical protein
MANGERKGSEYTALSLYQLLGAPLRALVDAEAHAADATASFIAKVGFEPGPSAAVAEAGTPATPATTSATAGGLDAWGGLGKLRMAHFHHTASDGAVHVIEVPVLSLVPIPALQIKEATVEFAVKVVDTLPIAASTADRRQGLLDPPPAVDLKGSIARQKAPAGSAGGASGTRQSETEMHVKVTMHQADVPSGLARLFNLMDGHVTADRVLRMVVSPPSLVLAPGEKRSVTVVVRNARGEPAVGVALGFESLDGELPLGFASANPTTDAAGRAVVDVFGAKAPAGLHRIRVRQLDDPAVSTTLDVEVRS